MAEITLDLIKKLREKTQVGMMDCKRALIDTDGDFEAAVEVLRKKGVAVAAKRAENETNNGSITALISPDYTSGALVEVSCETDFSANTSDMHAFCALSAKAILADSQFGASTPEAIAAVLASPQVGGSGTVQRALDELISKIAEKIKISRFTRYESNTNIITAYIHPGASLGVLVELAVDHRPADITTLVTAARDICMQIAVTNPLCILPEEVDSSLVEKEREIYKEQLRAEGKAEAMLDKIVVGKMAKFYEGVCLSRQKFIKDDSITIGAMLDGVSKKAGCTAAIKRFSRFAIGA